MKPRGAVCSFCDKTFKWRENLKRHTKRKHRIDSANGSFMILPATKPVKSNIKSVKKEHICYKCPVLKSYHSKASLKRHTKLFHKDKIGKITMGKSYIHVPTEVLKERKVYCHLCQESQTCISNLHVHILEKHHTTAFYPCNQCAKSFVSKFKLSLHRKRVHSEANKYCPFCEYKSPRTDTLRKHIWIHARKQNMKIYRKSQIYARAQKVKKDITKEISRSAYLCKNINWNEVLNSSEADISKQFSNLEPLTETETIDLIQDNNMTDSQILKIFSYLSKKWGRKIVTKKIAQKLISRKSLLKNFFTKKVLDTNSGLNFKSKDGRIIKRTVVYCHDIPGEICRK